LADPPAVHGSKTERDLTGGHGIGFFLGVNADEILALERPEPALWKLYIIRSILSGPLIILTLPVLYFRYYTLRYRFDAEGIHMKVGILFRREVNVTYARIQDIHLSSGIIQRWLGLADVQIQTASGTAGAELTIEGFHQSEAIRDFLYSRMRGARDRAHAPLPPPPVPGSAGAAANDEVVKLLLGIRDELKQTRELLEGRAAKDNAGDSHV
jgi:membrane protein YdbS with pleckstrin-like domain